MVTISPNIARILVALVLAGCGAQSSQVSSPATTNGPGSGTTGVIASAAASIALTPTPATVNTGGQTSSIQATVAASTGAAVADGTTVAFTVSSSALGSVTSSAVTTGGIATATFTSTNIPGSVTVTATSGSVSNTTLITITAPPNGSLEFVSATPAVIGIHGTGQQEMSTVQFRVKDINGNPVVDGTSVSFIMTGPTGGRLPALGGEYVGQLDATPTTASSSTVNGYADVILNSGSVAGTVTVAASVTSVTGTLTTSSGPISIGGGVPSATHFNIASSRINLAGLAFSGKEATVTAYVADRFGNYNVLQGTAVSFYAEAGAIDRSNTLDSAGTTSVIFRTQVPIPTNVTAIGWETTLQADLNTYYGVVTTAHPRDGWVTLLAAVMGEEAFNDANGNGLYDAGETIVDLGEPFYDKDDDGCRNDGVTKNCAGVISPSTEPFEEYIDTNANGQYDGPNGVWDGPGCTGLNCQTSKMIWTPLTVAFSGSAAYCAVSWWDTTTSTWKTTPFSILAGNSVSFAAMIGDVNTNHLPVGTTIVVSATVGELAGTTSRTLLDGLPWGPTEIGFVLTDGDTDSTWDSTAVTVTVVGGDGVAGCTPFITGTIQ